MAKRRFQKLPNGFGSVKKLSGNRRNPYGVYLPVTEYDLDGKPKSRKALCYVDSYLKGVEALTAWHKGTFNFLDLDMPFLNSFTQSNSGPTFSDVYERFIEEKFNSGREYSESTRGGLQASFKQFASLHNKAFSNIKYAELQEVVNNMEGSKSKRDAAVNLIKQMWKFGEKYELCQKDISVHLKSNKADDTVHGEAFTEEEIKTLWKHQGDPIIEMVLIMIYSGFRISAYEDMEVNLKDRYFRGGVKTAAGKDRIVPIHSSILPLVKVRMKREKSLLNVSVKRFRDGFKDTLKGLGMEHHPHDTRHTFSALCERYGVNEADRKRMLGHSFGSDITNGIYGHRTIEELREQIEKIQAPCCLPVTNDSIKNR